MATTSFDPFREIDRLFTAATRPSAGMPTDLYRDGDTFTMAIDLPGVDPASIDIDIEDHTLTISAERRSVAGEVQWLTRERPTGTFARQLTLGRNVAIDKIEADYADGVLTLTIPVAEEAKPRKVTVGLSGGHHTVQSEVTDTPADEAADPATGGKEEPAA